MDDGFYVGLLVGFAFIAGIFIGIVISRGLGQSQTVAASSPRWIIARDEKGRLFLKKEENE